MLSQPLGLISRRFFHRLFLGHPLMRRRLRSLESPQADSFGDGLRGRNGIAAILHRAAIARARRQTILRLGQPEANIHHRTAFFFQRGIFAPASAAPDVAAFGRTPVTSLRARAVRTPLPI